MYIPDFALGLIIGFVLGVGVLVCVALCWNNKEKGDD